MRRSGFTGDIWPDEVQQLLLRAAFLPGDRALEAWHAARPLIGVDRLPGELHRLMPHLSRALSTRGVDDDDLPRLKGVFQFTWYRNTMLVKDAATLVRALEGAGTRTMVLRGAAVVVGHGVDPGLRAMNDLDLLVPLGDVDRSIDLAASSGWRHLDARRQVEPKTGTIPLRNAAGRVVRLHRQPSPHLSLPSASWDGLWSRGVPVDLDGVSTMVPSAADHLVHACVDGARADSGASLRWVTDSMVVLEDQEAHVDWDVVVAEARRLRVSLLLSEALRYLAEVLDAPVPTAVLRDLRSTPATARDRMAHRLTLTTTPRIAPAAEITGRMVRLTAHLPIGQAVVTAPGVLAAAVGVERPRDLPAAVVRRVARAVVAPQPPRASLSQAGPVRVPAADAHRSPDGSRLAAP